MKKTTAYFHRFMPVICIAFVFVIHTAARATDNNRIFAGTAVVDYTPESVADSLIHDHQFIRVIAFSDGDKKALLIAHEGKNVRENLWEEITGRIRKETGIPPEYVIISAIHTHSGVPPGKEFNDKMMACVKQALANLEPARVGAGKGKSMMNMNRRVRQSRGDIWLGKNPDGPCDHDVDVLRVDNEEGKPLSVMVNFAAHAVINWPKPELYSGDWPGATAKFVEKALGNEITAPVTIGASGDLNPIYWAPYFDREGNKMEMTGRTALELGEEAVRVARETETYPAGKISASQRVVTLPGKKRFTSSKPNQEIVQGDDFQVRLSALKVGHVVITGIGGEVMTEIGMQIKDNSPFRNTFVVTHCNGSCGYLVTDKALKEGGYESTGSRSMPGCEKALVDTMMEMISGL